LKSKKNYLPGHIIRDSVIVQVFSFIDDRIKKIIKRKFFNIE